MNDNPTTAPRVHPPDSLPLVSVVIPVWNSAAFLKDSLDSVLSQDYPRMEVIAVDDGSTDGSNEILAAYGNRIRLLRQDNKGAAAARNLGVRSASGRFVAFLDADDVWLPGKLMMQMQYLLSHPDFKIVFGQFAFWHAGHDGQYHDPLAFLDKPETWEIKQELSGWIYADEILDSCIHMIAAVIYREVFEIIGGFDESLLAGSDYDFWLKATYRFRAYKIPRCLALYRIHPRGITGTPRTTNFPYLVLKRAVDTIGLVGPDGRAVARSVVRRRLAKSWLNFSLLHLDRGDASIGRRALREYLRVTGYSPSSLVNCAVVLARKLMRSNT